MKPYDVEQAKADVNRTAAEALDRLGAAIEGARIAAIEKLEVQASAFAELPRDVGSLFTSAAFVAIHEINSINAPGAVGGKVTVNYGVRFNGATMISPAQEAPVIPTGKYRAIFLLLPIEE